jgi:hypothetical protein
MQAYFNPTRRNMNKKLESPEQTKNKNRVKPKTSSTMDATQGAFSFSQAKADHSIAWGRFLIIFKS